MDVKEMSIVLETTGTVTRATISTTMTKPTAIMTQIASKEYLNILELDEYCRMVQSNLKEYETKIHMLISAKNEMARLKAEYLTRNKINMKNSESLVQAKNELFKYKCDLKSSYVTIEKSAKAKKLQYKKLLSSYEADWQMALEEYKSNPLVIMLQDIQRTNAAFEKNIEKRERLIALTKTQISELERNIKEKFVNKILDFSEALMVYKKFMTSQNVDREKNANGSNGNLKFSKSLIPEFGKLISTHKEDLSFSGIDVSVFDEITVPSENLEAQNEEEELFHLIQNQHSNDDNSDREESMEISYQNPDEQDKNEAQINTEENAKENIRKGGGEEDESQYFRTQGSECLRKSHAKGTAVENWGQVDENLNEYGNKEFNENSLPSNRVLVGNDEKINRDDNFDNGKQIDSEKSVSEASYENMNCYARDNFEYSYPKAQSVSSEELPLSAENESFGSPHKAINVEETNIFKLQGDQEKEEVKTFRDFFTINSDKNSTKPSIFKLF